MRQFLPLEEAAVTDLSQAKIKGRVSAGEWAMRVDVAACYRLPGQRRQITELEWPAMLRMLDRRDQGYRE